MACDQIPEGFVKHLECFGFSDLALQTIPQDRLFRTIERSSQHLANKLALRSQQDQRELSSISRNRSAHLPRNEIVYDASDLGSKELDALAEFINPYINNEQRETVASSEQGERLWEISLRFCDDFCLLKKKGDCYQLLAASLCAPSGWSLAASLGKTVRELHQPVPKLNALQGDAIDKMFERLPYKKYFQRFNWGLKPNESLAVFPDLEAGGRPGFKSVFLRIERQTLFRLTDDAIAFTIDVTTHDLEMMQENASETLEALMVAYRGLGKGAREYKKVEVLADIFGA